MHPLSPLVASPTHSHTNQNPPTNPATVPLPQPATNLSTSLPTYLHTHQPTYLPYKYLLSTHSPTYHYIRTLPLPTCIPNPPTYLTYHYLHTHTHRPTTICLPTHVSYMIIIWGKCLMVTWFIYLFCLLPIRHGGIGPFTAVCFRSLWLIKMSINRTGCGR